MRFSTKSLCCMCVIALLAGCASNGSMLSGSAKNDQKSFTTVSSYYAAKNCDANQISQEISSNSWNGIINAMAIKEISKSFSVKDEKNMRCKDSFNVLAEYFGKNLIYRYLPTVDEINTDFVKFLVDNGVNIPEGYANIDQCKANPPNSHYMNAENSICIKMNSMYSVALQYIEDIALEKLLKEQTCSIRHNNFIYTSSSCIDGFANGFGTAFGARGQMKSALVGEFSDGTFVKGKLYGLDGINWYDGQVDNSLRPHGAGVLIGKKGEQIYKGNFITGKASGAGVCDYNGTLEPCVYTAGNRTDQVHLMRLEVARMEKMLAEMKRERELAEQERQQAAVSAARAREDAEDDGGGRNSWVAGAINAINGGAAMMQQQMENDYKVTQKLRQEVSRASVDRSAQREEEKTLSDKKAELARMVAKANQSGSSSSPSGTENTTRLSTAFENSSYTSVKVLTDNNSASFQPGSNTNTTVTTSASATARVSNPNEKSDDGCWNPGPLSPIFVSVKQKSELCTGNCITVTVNNNSEGRIVADVCLHRQDGRPDDCGQIAVRPGGSNSYGGEGSDYTIRYWGSNKPSNDWTCKDE